MSPATEGRGVHAASVASTEHTPGRGLSLPSPPPPYRARESPPERTCPSCGGPVPPAAGSRVRVYCSPPCKERAKGKRKAARYRDDPEYRAQMRSYQTTRARQLGVKPMGPVTKVCQLDGCDRPHLAKGLCKRHYNRRRRELGLDKGARQTFPLTALIAGEPVVISCWLAVGVLAACPRCRAVMGATSPAHRFCPHCDLDAELNAEEVSAYAARLLTP